MDGGMEWLGETFVPVNMDGNHGYGKHHDVTTKAYERVLVKRYLDVNLIVMHRFMSYENAKCEDRGDLTQFSSVKLLSVGYLNSRPRNILPFMIEKKKEGRKIRLGIIPSSILPSKIKTIKKKKASRQ